MQNQEELKEPIQEEAASPVQTQQPQEAAAADAPQTPPQQPEKTPFTHRILAWTKEKWFLPGVLGFVAVVVALAVLSQFICAAGGMYYIHAESLDLRDKVLTEEDFQDLSEKMPFCRIRWNVPFQGGTVSSEETAVSVTSLTEEDVRMLGYVTGLQVVYGENCQDYLQLSQLQQQRPEVDVRYSVPIGGQDYEKDTRQLELSGLTREDAQRLCAFPKLCLVSVTDCEDYDLLQQLQREHPQWNLSYTVSVGGQTYPWDYSDLQTENLTAQELGKVLSGMPHLQTVAIANPQADYEALKALQEQYTGVELSWTVDLFGQTYDQDATEVDISGNIVEDCRDVEKMVACLPNLEKLIMSDCGIDDETMAQFRESKREDYKVVWTVSLGNVCTLRTDSEIFMPYQLGEGYLEDRETGALKYCEDIVCMDLGHHFITDVSFLQYMPRLKYLILAHTKVKDISPIVACQELIYLELDWSKVKDYSPLVELKKLEDLNLSRTYADLTPVYEMKWLKNLWIPNRPFDEANAIEALPDTHLELDSVNTKAWRHLPNYYAQRDMLGMFYMDQ